MVVVVVVGLVVEIWRVVDCLGTGAVLRWVTRAADLEVSIAVREKILERVAGLVVVVFVPVVVVVVLVVVGAAVDFAGRVVVG